MRAYTSLWLIRMLTFEVNELLKNAQRDAHKRKGARWSLQQFTERAN